MGVEEEISLMLVASCSHSLLFLLPHVEECMKLPHTSLIWYNDHR